MVLRFFLFVGALLFVSCTDVERDSPYDPEGKNYIGDIGDSSSSSIPPSSSSVATYAVTYNANSGTGAPANQKKIYDVALTLSGSMPARTGYVFAGWNTLADGSGTSYASGASYTDNASITLYAQWRSLIVTPVYYGGETYETVVIVDQVWMARNLNYNVEGSKCYDNNPSNCVIYGRLYDWYAAIAVCPEGWHLPSDVEWSTLISYVGNNAGTNLKATSGWNSGGNGTDYYGFAALPGGGCLSGGGFYDVGYFGSWWSATEGNANNAYGRYVYYGYEYVYRDYSYKSSLFSVRCLQDNSSASPSSSSVATYAVTYNAGTGVTGVTVPANQTKTHDVALTLSGSVPARAGYTFASWNTSADGTGMSYAFGASYTDNDDVTLYAQWTANTYTVTYNANSGTGVPANQTKTYDVALTLSGSVPTRAGYVFDSWNTSADGSGTSYASGASYTDNAGVTLYAQWNQTGIINGPSISYGGETYEYVVIGSLTWMSRNLNYAVEGSECYDDNESNCATYGRLYSWATAMALPGCGYGTSCASQIGTKHRGICPSGWHIPSDAEWTTLTDFVGGSSTAGKKSKATSGWNSCGPSGSGSSYLCEDSYGFAALPGGDGYSNGGFYNVGYYGYWWSATEDTANNAYSRYMDYYDEYVYNNNSIKINLFSVRCLQD